MTESPYDIEIESLGKEFDRIGEELSEAKLKRARYLCPFEIGDILVGRSGKRASVTEIYSGYNDDYNVKGAIIRKDGTSGRIARLYSWDDWTKEGR